jgi:hypothetical protein
VEDAVTDELRPDEIAPEEGDEDDETEEASEVWEVWEVSVEDGAEDCATEEDAAAEEPELCWEEAELWATEEVSEVEAWEEETTDEPEERATTVSERDVGEAELDAEEADDKSALLSPPVVLEGATDDPVVDAGALVVDGAEVSVLKETDVVLESVTRMASVLDEDGSFEEVVKGTAMTVALSAVLACLLRSSARTATSCFAISMRR